MRILIVEDEALVALQMRGALQRAGHQVTGVADTLTEAIESAEQHRPDLALVDLQLAQGCNGLDVAAELKKRGVPSLFLTGNCPGLDRGDLALGCLHKPFNETQLAAAVSVTQCLLGGQQPQVTIAAMHVYWG